MILIMCEKCEARMNCERNARFHAHHCPLCGHDVYLQGSKADNDMEHTRTLMRGHCVLIPKGTP